MPLKVFSGKIPLIIGVIGIGVMEMVTNANQATLGVNYISEVINIIYDCDNVNQKQQLPIQLPEKFYIQLATLHKVSGMDHEKEP